MPGRENPTGTPQDRVLEDAKTLIEAWNKWFLPGELRGATLQPPEGMSSNPGGCVPHTASEVFVETNRMIESLFD
jgi:hypothetical protein